MNAAATPSMTRQTWLEAALVELRARFVAKGYKPPANVRISIGWPRGSHGKGRAIGQCWALEASSDKHAEIFISPELGGAPAAVRIIGVLAHELVHATVGTAAGHKGPFKQCALAVGLEGKMTATTESKDFVVWAEKVVEKIGQYPAGRLSESSRKKQTTRLIKCECGQCGYTARVTKKWIAASGAPICPADGVEMECD